MKLPVPINYIAAFLRTIFFIWFILWFLFTGILAFILYLFIFNLTKGKRKVWTTFYVTKWWGRVLMAGALVFMRSKGTKNLDKNQSYVLVSNHLSMIDIPVSMSTCPVPFSFLAKKEVDKMPFVGYLARNMHVYVDRKSAESRKESIENMNRHLEEKSSIHLFVEGTRNKTDQPLQRFHKGAFNLAIDSQKPMAVLVIIGTQKIMHPRKKFQIAPGSPLGVWTEPIPTAGLTKEDIPALQEKVRNRMLEVLKVYGKA